jgi:hypothetical protein
MPDAPEQVSLYRVYAAPPFHQWACTIEEDETSAGGYCVIDMDLKVADSGFLFRLEQHMHSPATGAFSEERSGGIIVSGVETFDPGEPEHFGTAARTVPFAHVGPAPRSR